MKSFDGTEREAMPSARDLLKGCYAGKCNPMISTATFYARV